MCIVFVPHPTDGGARRRILFSVKIINIWRIDSSGGLVFNSIVSQGIYIQASLSTALCSIAEHSVGESRRKSQIFYGGETLLCIISNRRQRSSFVVVTVNHSAGLAKKDRRKIIIKPQRNKKKTNNRHPIKSRKQEEHGGWKKIFW